MVNATVSLPSQIPSIRFERGCQIWQLHDTFQELPERHLQRLGNLHQLADLRMGQAAFQGMNFLMGDAEDFSISRWLHDLTTRQLQGIKRGKRNWAGRGYAESTIAQWATAISSFYTAMESSSQG